MRSSKAHGSSNFTPLVMEDPAPVTEEPLSSSAGFSWIQKRDGRLVPFEADKISRALFAATEGLGRRDAFLARELTDSIVHFLGVEAGGTTLTTGQVADMVVKVVRELGHPALAHAFAGDGEALATIVERAKGPARDVVAPLARAFGAFSRSDWTETAAQLRTVLASHERIGGSRAQRDLIEYALVVCLLRSGRTDEARGLLQARRRRSGAGGWPIEGI